MAIIHLETDSPLEPFQVRLLQEHQELTNRIYRLNIFMDNNAPEEIQDIDPEGYLFIQKHIMYSYLSILDVRLNKMPNQVAMKEWAAANPSEEELNAGPQGEDL